MKLKSIVIVLVFTLLGVGIGTVVAKPLAAPAGNAFTYHGYLTLSGSAVTDSCDFEFTLYDADVAGSMVGSPVAVNALAVNSGQFTTSLDFGASPFGGDARWLEIKVRCPAGSGVFTTLTPRQELTAVPYALFSFGAPWGGITGIPADIADGDQDTHLPALLDPGFHTNTAITDYTELEGVDIAIGVDGLPNIVHVERGDVYLTRCADMECSSIGTWVTVGSGSYPGITMGASGAPLIVYNTGGDLTLVTCINTDCSENTTEAVGPGLGHPDIVLAADGLPRIAVKDAESDYMLLYYPTCDGCEWTSQTLTHGSPSFPPDEVAGEHAAMVLSSEGHPIISYFLSPLNAVVVALCADSVCTSAAYELVSPQGLPIYTPPQGTAIAISPHDGFEVLYARGDLYYGTYLGLAGSTWGSWASDCVDSCPGGDADLIGHGPSIVMDEDGYSMVVYLKRWNQEIWVNHGVGPFGGYVIGTLDFAEGPFSSAITIGADDMPIMAFTGMNNGELTLQTVHCSNKWCLPYYRPY